MESQNHYYGHSAAFALYLGLPAPRHVRGLVQHGWTAVSPLGTHFRDFPRIGAPDGPADRRLLVWSHRSRAWDPASADRASVPIGAPWLYLCSALGTLDARSAPRDGAVDGAVDGADGSSEDGARTGAGTGAGTHGTVILPVHGIATQRLQGDHRAVAREWARTEGPSTVCLYHVEARDPDVVTAYVDAGHTCVTLGERTDPAFLGRLHTLLTGAERVVSNRLSTPVVYAAALGIDTAVHGDGMALEGEDPQALARVRALWPEMHDDSVPLADRRAVAADELGLASLREPDELVHLLGWDRTLRVGPWWQHWVSAPASRAVTTVRRRRGAAGDPGPTTAPTAAGPTAGALSATRFLVAAASYLPHPIGRVIRPGAPLPVVVPRTDPAR
ncbi:hypothetical protein Q9R32_04035 [Actinotalea sp. AC32]|nr:hypothetical protein [Actinotalea sp. AC32]